MLGRIKCFEEVKRVHVTMHINAEHVCYVMKDRYKSSRYLGYLLSKLQQRLMQLCLCSLENSILQFVFFSHSKICTGPTTLLFFVFLNMRSPCKTTIAASKSFSSAAQIFGMHCQTICLPFQLFLLLEELSNITYSSLLTLTVVQNLVRSNQLNVSHFVIQRQLLPLRRPETPCRPSKGVPSERL